MIEHAEGIILRTWPFSETSLIIHWLTANCGRISTLAKGARRPKSPFRGKLDLFYLADFTYQRSQRSDLHLLREVSLRETRSELRHELNYVQQASYCAALAEQSTERETPLPAVFQLMRDFLDALPTRPPQPQMVFAFELKLLNELGLKPDLKNARLTAGAKEIMRLLGNAAWPNVLNVKLSQAQMTELKQFLHGFLVFHLERIPKGRLSALGETPRSENRASGP